jgi:hypothetical protein
MFTRGGILAGQQRGARRRTDGARGVSGVERRALARERVDPRRLREPLSVRPDVAPSHVVDEDDDDVRTPSRFIVDRSAARKDKDRAGGDADARGGAKRARRAHVGGSSAAVVEIEKEGGAAHEPVDYRRGAVLGPRAATPANPDRG